MLSDRARDIFRRKRQYRRPPVEDFWALKDLSFEVRCGEVTGVIGRNGAGKSTLLKVISRITEPTAGRIELTGRVASMLEVGTGFHPELTGRENIFLNGAILGMRHAEIKRRFDEIVAFSEVENFLDTPVKRFSSGMYVRLAFAVAAHLHTEILIVDEVLADRRPAEVPVKRCLRPDVPEVARTARPHHPLFASHKMAAIRRLTRHRCILLDHSGMPCSGIDAADRRLRGDHEYYLVKDVERRHRRGFTFIGTRYALPTGTFYVDRVTTRRECRTASIRPGLRQFDCDSADRMICVDYARLYATRLVVGLHSYVQLQRPRRQHCLSLLRQSPCRASNHS